MPLSSYIRSPVHTITLPDCLFSFVEYSTGCVPVACLLLLLTVYLLDLPQPSVFKTWVWFWFLLLCSAKGLDFGIDDFLTVCYCSFAEVWTIIYWNCGCRVWLLDCGQTDLVINITPYHWIPPLPCLCLCLCLCACVTLTVCRSLSMWVSVSLLPGSVADTNTGCSQLGELCHLVSTP